MRPLASEPGRSLRGLTPHATENMGAHSAPFKFSKALESKGKEKPRGVPGRRLKLSEGW